MLVAPYASLVYFWAFSVAGAAPNPMNDGENTTRKLGQYCLKCFASIDSQMESCSACGYKVRALERREFWNMHPSMLRVQSIALGAALGLGALSGYLILVELNSVVVASFRTGRASFALLVSIWFVLAALIQSVSLLTRHEPTRMPLPWPILGVGFGLLGYWMSGWMLAAPLFAITPLSLWIRARFRAWKHSLIAGERVPAGPAPAS